MLAKIKSLTQLNIDLIDSSEAMLVLNNLPNVQILNGRSTKEEDDDEEEINEIEEDEYKQDENNSNKQRYLYSQMEQIEEIKNLESNSEYTSTDNNNNINSSDNKNSNINNNNHILIEWSPKIESKKASVIESFINSSISKKNSQKNVLMSKKKRNNNDNDIQNLLRKSAHSTKKNEYLRDFITDKENF